MPASVTIPAGAASIDFEISGVDDRLLDRSQVSTVTASAAAYDRAIADVTVDDYESLAVSILSSKISEEGGATVGRVERSNTDVQSPLTVLLSSSDLTEARVPASVTIPAGQAAV